MNKDQPLPREKLTVIGIPIEVNRHIEALWAEITSLKEEVSILKKKVHDLEIRLPHITSVNPYTWKDMPNIQTYFSNGVCEEKK